MTDEIGVPMLRKMKFFHSVHLLLSEEMTCRPHQGRIFPFIRKSKPEMNDAIGKVEQGTPF